MDLQNGYLLQHISKAQASYCLKTPQISSFSSLVPMDVRSLYTNISHEEGIATVCSAYDEFHRNNPLIPTKYLREMIKLILRQFFPIQWKELPSNPWYCYGHKNGRCFCKHFYRYITLRAKFSVKAIQNQQFENTT